MLLQNGQIAAIGKTDAIVQQYLTRALPAAEVVRFDTLRRAEAYGGRVVILRAEAPEGRAGFHYDFCEAIAFDLIMEAKEEFAEIELRTTVSSVKGFEVLDWSTKCAAQPLGVAPGLNRVRIALGGRLLPGWYKMRLSIKSSKGQEDHLHEAMDFEVRTNALAAKIGADTFQGIVVPEGRFSVVETA